MRNTEKLTQLTAELEGLLHVLARRDSESLRNLIKNKYSDFTSEFDLFLESLQEDEPREEIHAIEEAVHNAAEIEAKEQEAVEPEVDDEMDAAVNAVEHEEEKTSYAAQPDFDYTFENDINEFASDEEDTTPAQETVQTSERVRYTEPEISSELKVDRMLTRKEASDLKRVFTLNDKFRFRRALFNQDDTKFAEALKTLSSLASYEEAVDTAVNKFGWDLNNPDVEDFLAIIKPHYE